MEITDTSNYIRQQQPGQFRRSEDSKEPFFAHVNGQKLDSTNEQKECAVYMVNEEVVALEKEIGSYSYVPKLFDLQVGVKFNTEKINGTNKEGKIQRQYGKTEKVQVTTKQESFIDQWA
ncbi:unnamed protein product [marine sediment metagenome]|uniref:Uncharacterized protein n=1 Tax=marine sediment metagenome TaxID=412755 RepID=X0TM59_9ZZZZ